MSEQIGAEQPAITTPDQVSKAIGRSLPEVEQEFPTLFEVLSEDERETIRHIAHNVLAMDETALVARAKELEESEDPAVGVARQFSVQHQVPPLPLAYAKGHMDATKKGMSEAVAHMNGQDTAYATVALVELAAHNARALARDSQTPLEAILTPEGQMPALNFMSALVFYAQTHLRVLRHQEVIEANKKRFNEELDTNEDREALVSAEEVYRAGESLARHMHPEVFEDLDETTQNAAMNAIKGSITLSVPAITQAAEMLDTSEDPLLKAVREHDASGASLRVKADGMRTQLDNLQLHPADTQLHADDALFSEVTKRQFAIYMVQNIRASQGVTTEQALTHEQLKRGEDFIAAVMVGANYAVRHRRYK